MALTICAAPPARAFVISEDALAERSTELGLLLRSFGFMLTGRILREPYIPLDANPSGIGLLDLRLSFAHKTPWLEVVLHNQLTGRVTSHGELGPVALGRGLPPPRWAPLQADIAEQDGFTLRETVDWAYAAVLWGRATITAGRQPITFGRGKLWQPLDLISTFAITEVDTEYKPGADALRVDLNPLPGTFISVVATAGEWDEELALQGSTFSARVKQAWSSGEAGALAGFIRGDVVAGADAVWDAGAFDLYGELTVTLTTDRSLTPSDRDAVIKGVAGATFRPTTTLAVSPELFYNGFGAWDREGYLAVALSERVGIGELYSLGRLYAGLTAAWEAHPLLSVTGAAILNARDPSALLSLGLSYSVATNVALIAGGYIPAGSVPQLHLDRATGAPVAPPTPRSEYGLYPYFVYVELKAAM